MKEDEVRFLVIKAKGGFGNRILSAATGIVLAALTQRTPVIDWRDGEYLGHGVNAYPILFESKTWHRPEEFDDRVDVDPSLWRGRMAQHPTHVISELFPEHHSNPFIYRKLSINLARPKSNAPIVVFWSYLPKMARLRRRASRQSEFRGMNQNQLIRWALHRYFKPNHRIESELQKLFAHRPGPVIGVHIRYTDRKVSLKRVFREVERLRRRLPSASIFLATDNSAVQMQFRRTFDRVFFIEKELGDDQNSLHEHVVSEDPQREAENALIDMWALASCEWLVHSRHSTFSVAAAILGDISPSRQRDIDRWNPKVVVKRWIQTWA